MAAVSQSHSSAYPINMPSKTPPEASYYPISRVAGSPPDMSDASTTAGSRSTGGSTFSNVTGDYESSAASCSGVDVVDMLSDRMNNAFDPTRLDKGLATQAQTYDPIFSQRSPDLLAISVFLRSENSKANSQLQLRPTQR